MRGWGREERRSRVRGTEGITGMTYFVGRRMGNGGTDGMK